LDNIAGPPVEGENFFGRESEIATLWKTLHNHDVLLLGPRRIGKTSAARELMRVAEASNWHAIEVNIASCANEHAFVEKLAKCLEVHQKSWAAQVLARIGSRLSDFLQRLKGVKVGVPGTGSIALDLNAARCEDWTDLASDILLLMSEVRERWLIYVDELPVFLFSLIERDPATGVSRARRFLDWFRNDVRAMPECSQVRWLVTGSVGLDTLVQRHRMAATLNSMRHETLEPFTDSVAQQMVGKLAASYNVTMSADETTSFIRAIQWPQPYYLQLVFHFLRQSISATGKPPRELIAQAIERTVQPEADNDFHHWEERLTTQLGNADAYRAVALLTVAAQKQEGAQPETLLTELQRHMLDYTADEQREKFIELRDILQRDAYWWPDESSGQRRYRFRLELLRLWWVRRRKL
jgi:hypothetical protein